MATPAAMPGSMTRSTVRSHVRRKAQTLTTSCTIRMGSRIAAPRTGSMPSAMIGSGERADAGKAALGEPRDDDGSDRAEREEKGHGPSLPA